MADFWGRVKKNTSQLTNAIGPFPGLGNDTDGKVEYETIIHKALVSHYEEYKNGQAPDWLVENDPNFNQSNFQTTNLPSNNKFYPVGQGRDHGGDYGNYQESNGGNYGGNYGGSHVNSHGNSHSSGYGNGPATNGRPSTSRTSTPASASLHNMYKSSRNSGSSIGSGSSAQGRTTTNNNIRDRLQKSKTSSATANRLQSNWNRR